MKQGMTLPQLAEELQRQREVKRDFIADTRKLAVRPVLVAEREKPLEIPTSIEMQINGDVMPVRKNALRQIGQRLKIPAAYVDRLAANYPDMLSYNINGLFSREPESRMIRTMDGQVRAFLSDKYRPLDNFDFASAVLPHLINHGAEVTSCDVTESRLYIKAVRPDLVKELPPPPGAVMGTGHQFFVEKIQAGICLSNSEIGQGRLAVQPATFTKRCTNYAVFTDSSYFKVHLGRQLSGGDESSLWEVYSDQTKEQSDKAVWMQVNDLVKAAMDGTLFDKIVEQMMKARGDQITSKIPEVVELTGKKFGLTQNEQDGILNQLIMGGDLTRYGLHNAVTRYSQEVDDYDRASDLEQIGGQIIELDPSQWRTIEKKAA